MVEKYIIVFYLCKYCNDQWLCLKAIAKYLMFNFIFFLGCIKNEFFGYIYAYFVCYFKLVTLNVGTTMGRCFT